MAGTGLSLRKKSNTPGAYQVAEADPGAYETELACNICAVNDFSWKGCAPFLVRRQRCNKPSDPGCLPSDCFNTAFGLIRRIRCFRALGRLLQVNGGKSEPHAKFAPGRNYPNRYLRTFALRAPALCEGWLASRNPGSTDDRRQRSIWILLRLRTRKVADGTGRPDPKVPGCRRPIGKHCLPSGHVRSPVRQR